MSGPNVWIDGSVFENDRQRGIWRVFYEIMRRSAAQLNYTLWLRSPPRQPLPEGIPVVRDAGRRLGAIWNPLSHARRFASRYAPPRALRGAQVFHSTFFSPCPVRGPVPVVSVYDMVVERLFGICGEWAVSNIAEKRAAIGPAAMCVAISRATAADLQQFYPGKPTVVVHLGAEHLGNIRESKPPAGFALYVGDRGFYKNFDTVLSALRCPAWPSGVPLKVAGPPFRPHERMLLSALGLADRVHPLGRVTDAELSGLYRTAACLVVPSLLEGFGLPILEAQANGCPVVLSDTEVFREVAGNAGLYFDPRLGERLAESVATAVKPEVRNRLIEAGHENVRRFSWDAAAAQMVAVYHRAAASPTGRPADEGSCP